jgi:phosphoribosyl 1,2-cyclic phosphate phosphodiesterase
MKLTFLGTGTSQGVPIIACDCLTCTSEDPRDKRLRTSALLEWDGQRVLFDIGPDFRAQMLRENIRDLDAIVLTHAHRDHIGGLDDIRPINFRQERPMPVYATRQVIAELLRCFPYILDENYGGRPRIDFREIHKDEPFVLGGKTFRPVEAQHGPGKVLGFRVDDWVYMTDAHHIEAEELEKMLGARVLVLNALQILPHYSHFTLAEALEVVERIQPERAFFVHMAHHLGRHTEVCATLPPSVTLAYDGLSIS